MADLEKVNTYSGLHFHDYMPRKFNIVLKLPVDLKFKEFRFRNVKLNNRSRDTQTVSKRLLWKRFFSSPVVNFLKPEANSSTSCSLGFLSKVDSNVFAIPCGVSPASVTPVKFGEELDWVFGDTVEGGFCLVTWLWSCEVPVPALVSTGGVHWLWPKFKFAMHSLRNFSSIIFSVISSNSQHVPFSGSTKVSSSSTFAIVPSFASWQYPITKWSTFAEVLRLQYVLTVVSSRKQSPIW